MNAPDYRARHRIQTDADQIVTSTATMTRATRARMLALRKVQVVAEQYGVLSHVARFLQWDHGVAVTDLLDHLLDVITVTPERFPLLTWVLEYFDLHATAPVGWGSVMGEIARLLAEDHGLDPAATDLATVLQLQAALLPAPQRRFPDTVDLAHDYATYYRDATAQLYTSGRAGRPPQPLVAYPPASFTVTSDPLRLCDAGLRFAGDSRDESMLGQFWIGVGSSHELTSALARVSPRFRDLELAASTVGPTSPDGHDPLDDRTDLVTPVTIGRAAISG